MKLYIYALVCDDFSSPQSLQDGPDEIAFYIGITKNLKQRMSHHKSASRKGSEDKYKYIRELESKNIDWNIKKLEEIDSDDERPWEYWFVIEYIRKGSPLKNMRYGNMNKISETKLVSLSKDKTINSIDDLHQQLKKKSKQTSYNASNNVQKRAILKELRFLRTEQRTSDRSKWVNIYDLGEGTEEIRSEFYMKKEEVAELCTPSVRNNLERLKESVAKSCSPSVKKA